VSAYKFQCRVAYAGEYTAIIDICQRAWEARRPRRRQYPEITDYTA
jgi:hypothetical protein